MLYRELQNRVSMPGRDSDRAHVQCVWLPAADLFQDARHVIRLPHLHDTQRETQRLRSRLRPLDDGCEAWDARRTQVHDAAYRGNRLLEGLENLARCLGSD